MIPKYSIPIKAAIFDNDGTLVDTQFAYEYSDGKLIGRPLDPQLKTELAGKTAIDSIRLMLNKGLVKGDIDELIKIRSQYATSCFEHVNLMPGARKVVLDIRARGIRTAVATSSRKEMFELKTKHHQDLFSGFDNIVVGNEIKKGKPAPDIFLAAMSKWKGIKPEEIVVFEDALQGVKAATNAGMASVLITQNDALDDMLKEENVQPTYIIKSLEDFNMDFFYWAPQ